MDCTLILVSKSVIKEGENILKFSHQEEIELSQLLALYNIVGGTAYTRESDKLKKAIQQSLSVITVWDDSDNNSQLIGLIRGVGDGETILYIQDILVIPTLQNRVIGRQMMEQLLSMY